jgi:hypothetical protein
MGLGFSFTCPPLPQLLRQLQKSRALTSAGKPSTDAASFPAPFSNGRATNPVRSPQACAACKSPGCAATIITSAGVKGFRTCNKTSALILLVHLCRTADAKAPRDEALQCVRASTRAGAAFWFCRVQNFLHLGARPVPARGHTRKRAGRSAATLSSRLRAI